jgi:O-antigen/teichoic acid export membrane protein
MLWVTHMQSLKTRLYKLLRWSEKYTKTDMVYVGKNGFWLLVAQAVTLLGGLITTIFFANILSEHDYGVYRYLIGLGGLFATLSLTGMGQAVVQATAKGFRSFYSESVRLTLLYGTGITAVSLAGAIYYYTQGNNTLALGCLLIAVFQPVINTFQNVLSFLQGEQRFREITYAQAARSVGVTSISIVVLFVTQNVVLLLATHLGTYALAYLLIHLFYARKRTGQTDTHVKKNFITFAKNTSIRKAVSQFTNRLDILVIFTQLGSVELAIYTVATIIPDHIKSTLQNIDSLLLPKFARHTSMDMTKKSVTKRSFQLLLLFTGIAILYAVLAPYAYHILFPEYDSAILYSQLLALSFPTLVHFVPYTALQTNVREKLLYSHIFSTSVLQAILVLFFTLTYGLIGAIVARIVYRYVALFLVYILFYSIKSK